MSWFNCFIRTSKSKTNAPPLLSNSIRYEVQPTDTPHFLLTESDKRTFKLGREIEKVSEYTTYRARHRSDCSVMVFPSKEACLNHVRSIPPGKFWIASITDHVCTEVVIVPKEEC